MKTKQKYLLFGILIAILFAAFALRIFNIENLPAGIYPDEAQNGTDALQAIATGEYKLFYEPNYGREGLFINLQALSINILGNTTLALKLWSVIFGTLTVLGVFLLSKEVFRSHIAGLVSAYLIAFSYWAINFSRIGFRAIMVPFILSFAFYFILKGLRTRKFHDFLIAGLIYGLGLHTYIAFRVSPLVLIVLFASLLITRKHFLKEYWKHVLVFIIAMFITAAPMLLDFFLINPHHYASRTGAISVFNPESNQGKLLATIGKTFSLSIQKYFGMGDLNMRHNYPPYALLNPIVGVAFLIGLIYIFSNFFKLLWLRFKKDLRSEKMDMYALLLAWFFALLIPEFLANEGNPHALRAIGTLPVVILIATIPFLWILEKYHSFGHSFRIFTISMLVAAFVFIGLADPIKYFVYFANSPKQHEVFNAHLKEISSYIRALPQTTEKYIIIGSMERLTIKYLNPNLPNTFYVYPDQIDTISPSDSSTAIYIISGRNYPAVDALAKKFPNLKFAEHKNDFGDIFLTMSN